MPDDVSHYDNPLISRYASAQMSAALGPAAEVQHLAAAVGGAGRGRGRTGPAVTARQIDELRAHVDDIDFAAAERYERRLRHDVMAHVHAYGDLCPAARPIIHLGATSCYVTDNTDLLLLREAWNWSATGRWR